MRAPGFFDLEERFAKLDELGDPLLKITNSLNWKEFRAVLTDALSKPRKSKAGRKEYDRMLMFRILVLQQLYNLSGAQTEYQIRDRYSFGRSLRLQPEDVVPDAKRVWRFREGLKLAGLLESLYGEMLSQVESQGCIARQGRILSLPEPVPASSPSSHQSRWSTIPIMRVSQSTAVPRRRWAKQPMLRGGGGYVRHSGAGTARQPGAAGAGGRRPSAVRSRPRAG